MNIFKVQFINNNTWRREREKVYCKVGNFIKFETLWRFSLVDMKMRKFSSQESGLKVICSGHAYAIAAMHHIVRAMPFCNDRESMNREN